MEVLGTELLLDWEELILILVDVELDCVEVSVLVGMELLLD